MSKGKGRQKGGGRRTRFNLTRKGELALATVGVLVIALALFLLWGLVSPRLVPLDKEKAAREGELSRQYESRWRSLQMEGVVLHAVEERQDIYVDPQKWSALLPTEQTFAAAAICGHFKWRRCFVYDGSGQRLGWYSESDGYQRVKPLEEPRG